jgi:hypothetical protein
VICNAPVMVAASTVTSGEALAFSPLSAVPAAGWTVTSSAAMT